MTFKFIADNGTRVEVPAEYLDGTSLEDVGYCLYCGAERANTEPDAENYTCDKCGDDTVFGAQQLLMMGHIK